MSEVIGVRETIFVADVDGTLTPARQSMTDDFAKFLEQFLENHVFYIVTGSDLNKIKEQVPTFVRDKFAGMFCSLGNEFYVENKLVYKNSFIPASSLLEKLEEYRKNTTYDGELFPNYIEERCGMFNFSVLGRDCSMSDRDRYAAWDEKHQERLRIVEELSVLFPEYVFSIGGNISVDIVPQGRDKSQVATKLREKYPTQKIVFIGDRIEPNGNDYPLAEALKKSGNSEIISVRGPQETLEFLSDYCK